MLITNLMVCMGDIPLPAFVKKPFLIIYKKYRQNSILVIWFPYKKINKSEEKKKKNDNARERESVTSSEGPGIDLETSVS